MILVTGGAGYIGSLLVRELLALVETDIRECGPECLEDVSAVIHLAGLSNDPTADFAPYLNSESNVQATRQLAQVAAEKAELERREIRFLFASSSSVYYSPSVAEDVDIERMTEELPIAPTANYR